MKKLLIWGTGNISAELCRNGINGCIVGFIETEKSKEKFVNIPVYSIEEPWPEHDYIIVANNYSNEIYKKCISRGISLDQFIFLYPIGRVVGETDLDILKEILPRENYIQYCMRYGLFWETFFKEDLQEYRRKNTRHNFDIDENNLWPVIRDKCNKAGTMRNYFWQDLWAAKLIGKTGVKKHFDIGSRIDGFIAHLLCMGVDVTIIDIREFPGQVEGLHTIVDDATLLRQIPEGSIMSMSALCSLEHFGLGRYGDTVDPEACFRCFEEIQKRMKKGGNLYLSLPVGRERVEFNAHRVFYASTIVSCFSNMKLAEYSCTADGEIEYNVDIHRYDNDENNGDYRYGLFHFVKA